jgi:hypothetical protein
MAKTSKKQLGSAANRLKNKGDWWEAAKKATKKEKPAEGWPDHKKGD